MSTPDIRQLLAQKNVSGLVDALKNKDIQVGTQAAIALGSLGFEAKVALPALREVLASRQTLKGSMATPKNAKDFARGLAINGYYEKIQNTILQIERV